MKLLILTFNDNQLLKKLPSTNIFLIKKKIMSNYNVLISFYFIYFSLDGKVTKDQDCSSFTSKLQLKKQTQPKPSRNKLLCINLSFRLLDSWIAHYIVNLNIVRIVFLILFCSINELMSIRKAHLDCARWPMLFYNTCGYTVA